MYQRILTAVIFVVVMGLLVHQRFDVQASLPVIVQDSVNSTAYDVGDSFVRGSVLSTEEEFLHVLIGYDTHLYLAPRTRVELKRLHEDELVLDFTKGRIFVAHDGLWPLHIETNHTKHSLAEGEATFVNFDFLETVQVIPLEGEINSMFADEQLILQEAVSIHETPPVTYEAVEVDFTAGDAGAFYEWVFN